MIFVVGARRSGTNWLQRVLAAHPDALAVPSETYLFSMGIRPLRERFHQGAARSSRTGFVYMDRDAMIDALRDLCDAVFCGLVRSLDPAATKVIERTPDHVRHLDLIGEVYPDAHIVHIVRDGRDVVRSLLSHDWGPDEPRHAAEEWRTAIESARTAAANNANYREVRYEDLLADPRGVLAPLFASVGLAADEAVIADALAEGGVSYNIDPASPRVEASKWLTELSDDVLRSVEDVAGPLLSELGYEPAPKGAARAAKAAPSKRRLRRPRAARGPSPRRRLDLGLKTLDRFLDAAANDIEAIRPALGSNLWVRIVTRKDRFEGRGRAAAERLIETIRADEAMRKPQSSGYVHPGDPSITFVGEFEVDGRHEPRVVILVVDEETIERVSFYALGPG
jgi:hypothetical protein